jgi:hypothetical protein
VKGYHVVEHSGGWAYYNFPYTQIPELGLSVIVASNNEFDYPIGMAETFIHSILPNDRMLNIVAKDVMVAPAWIQSYVSDQFTVRSIEFDRNMMPLAIRNSNGDKRYPIFEDSSGNRMDSTGNVFELVDGTARFRWSGGGYFNVPTVFHAVDTPYVKFHVSEGKFENDELGTIRIRYNRRKEKITFTSSFGKNSTVLEIRGRYFNFLDVDYDLFVRDNDTLVIGNSYVFNLVFTRK